MFLKPLIFTADFIAFAASFWGYKNGFLLSITLAILTHFAMLIGVGLPIGYVLGKRAARRFQGRL
jgi:hypothetical protein